MTVDVLADAEARYRAARRRLALLQKEWRDAGRPTTSVGSQKQLIEHPMMKMLRELEATCDRLGARLIKRHDGPEPVAVVEADVSRSPATKIRRIA